MLLDTLTFETAKPLEGTVFRFDAGDGQSIDLELVSVLQNMPNRERPKRLKRDSFSLYFQGPKEVMLRQGSYPLTSETVSFDMLFLVPIGPNENGFFEYEAVFT